MLTRKLSFAKKKCVLRLHFLKEKFSECSSKLKRRSVAQSGSAPDLGSGGRRFESYRSDHDLIWQQDDATKVVEILSYHCMISKGYNHGCTYF